MNRSLDRYVKDPKGFRSFLATCNALISGSFVLRVLDRDNYYDADLDIFMCRDDDEKDLVDYLLGKEGYSKIPQREIQHVQRHCIDDPPNKILKVSLGKSKLRDVSC